MRVLITPDSFKEACTARQAAEAIARGWSMARPQDQLHLLPLADGGEGTVEAVAAAWRLEPVEAEVCGPLGDPVQAMYAWDAERRVAVLEMASASGLALVPPNRRNPRVSSTRGVGQLIAHAAALGAREIILGLGGSATNDAGAGALAALGVALLDKQGQPLPPGGAALQQLARVAPPQAPAAQMQIRLACDVTNPLCGPNGASQTYGPQKGATPADVEELDRALLHFAEIVDPTDTLRSLPGAGAAGGLAFGLMSLAGATLHPGFNLIADAVNLDQHLAAADLVISGEGRLDAQSLQGKTLSGVVQRAVAHGVPVLLLAGQLCPGYEPLLTHGRVEAHAITPSGMSLSQALRETAANLTRAAHTAALSAKA